MYTPTQPSDNVKQSFPESQLIPHPFSNGQRMTHRRKRKVELPECAEDVLNNLHRYPLLVWHDPTSSKDSEDSLLEQEDTITLLSFVTSKCETEEVIEWKDLMEWFVCSVIGLESKASWVADSFWFDWDDVVVDRSGRVRINIFASPSGSSPPQSPLSFSAAVSNLCQLFLAMIGQLSMSKCLPTRINQHFRDSLVPTVILRLIDHLVSTGQFIPIFEPSDLDGVISETTRASDEELSNDIGLHDALLCLIVNMYILVQHLENEDLVSHTVRLTDPEIDPRSPKFANFSKLLEPALDEIEKQFDPDLYEEAKRITLWRDLVEKIAIGEEVENDKSFLKLSFFRPTLLSLQAKFQHLASSKDESEDSSTLSLHSSHSTPHTSLEAHLDSSLRTRSSTVQFKQESLQLLTILHSLLTSPLPPSLTKPTPKDPFQIILAFSHLDDLDPTERFDSSIFDEDNDEILTRSLIRCFSVCDLVGADNCIIDVPTFFDRTVSTLSSSDHQVRHVAGSLISRLYDKPSVDSQLPHVWTRLRSAFRDGWPEEQFAFLLFSSKLINASIVDESPPPFTLTEFDWDGLFAADLSEMPFLVVSINLLMAVRTLTIATMDDADSINPIILSFERHHLASSRILLIMEDSDVFPLRTEFVNSLLSYLLIVALLTKSDFHSSETDYIAGHPEIDVRFLIPYQHNFVLLSHTSLNRHKPRQPPLDLLFERALRTNPLTFFFTSEGPYIDIALSLFNNSLCGFHALCRRGVHLSLLENEYVRFGRHVVNSHWMFTTPFLSDTFLLFLHFPPPLVVRFFLPALRSKLNPSLFVNPLRLIMPTLLLVTAPFGDCVSLKELFRSVRHRINLGQYSSTDNDLTLRCESLEWLSIPTGFGSALAHSNIRESLDDPPETLRHSTTNPKFLSVQTRSECDEIAQVGSLKQC